MINNEVEQFVIKGLGKSITRVDSLKQCISQLERKRVENQLTPLTSKGTLMTDFRLLTPVEIERLVRARLKVVRSQLSKLAITSISAQTVSSRELQKENRSVPSGLLIWQLT